MAFLNKVSQSTFHLTSPPKEKHVLSTVNVTTELVHLQPPLFGLGCDQDFFLSNLNYTPWCNSADVSNGTNQK